MKDGLVVSRRDSTAGNAEPRRAAPEAQATAPLERGPARPECDAIELLYDQYKGAVYRYLYRQTGSREAAEDLTSTTFLRALAGLDRFTAGRPALPWLMRIAHNVLVDHRRAAVRTVSLTAAAMPETGQVMEAGSSSTLEGADAFLAYTHDLPAAQRDALALRYIADLSIEQTAAALGRSTGATKMLVQRALTTLRARTALMTRRPTDDAAFSR